MTASPDPPLPGPPLRLAVLGDFEGPHTRAWLRTFVERGHDVHAISYYQPRAKLPGVTLHVLKGATLATSADPLSPGERARVRGGSASAIRRLVPPTFQRLINAWRYRRAGLRRVLDEIRPDVFHAHYAVEHGFYGAFAGFHPYMISAWGSDLLVESHKMLGRRIARWALSKADLVTGNDATLVQRAVELGVAPEKVATVHLGIERLFLEAGEHSVNLAPAEVAGNRAIGQSGGESPPAIVSYRALEPLYNVDTVLRAFARLRSLLPDAQLLVAGRGSREEDLRRQATALSLSASVQFLGYLAPATIAETLGRAQVYVSVPSSDSLALSNLEAMAAGAFPIVSDLPSVDGWIEHGVNGLRVPPRDVDALAAALQRALNDPELRRSAAVHNRRLVEERGLREPNMLLMERHYYRLAGHPVEERGSI